MPSEAGQTSAVKVQIADYRKAKDVRRIWDLAQEIGDVIYDKDGYLNDSTPERMAKVVVIANKIASLYAFGEE